MSIELRQNKINTSFKTNPECLTKTSGGPPAFLKRLVIRQEQRGSLRVRGRGRERKDLHVVIPLRCLVLHLNKCVQITSRVSGTSSPKSLNRLYSTVCPVLAPSLSGLSGGSDTT